MGIFYFNKSFSLESKTLYIFFPWLSILKLIFQFAETIFTKPVCVDETENKVHLIVSKYLCRIRTRFVFEY